MSLAGEERKKSIIAMLNEHGKVNVSELSRHFDVSTETIRRDLDELEKDNKLKKVYGGAVKHKADIELAYSEHEIIHAEEKRIIGALAANMIDDNDVIVIDEGSTAMQMLHCLDGKRNLTVFVCSIPTLTLLIDYHNRGSFDGKIIFIGGEVNPKHLRVSGPIAEKIMEDFYVNKSFISVDGVSLENGLTSYDYDRALFTRRLIRSAETVIALADGSKIGKRTVAKIDELGQIQYVVSNIAPPSGWQEGLQDLDVSWISPE